MTLHSGFLTECLLGWGGWWWGSLSVCLFVCSSGLNSMSIMHCFHMKVTHILPSTLILLRHQATHISSKPIRTLLRTNIVNLTMHTRDFKSHPVPWWRWFIHSLCQRSHPHVIRSYNVSQDKRISFDAFYKVQAASSFCWDVEHPVFMLRWWLWEFWCNERARGLIAFWSCPLIFSTFFIFALV